MIRRRFAFRTAGSDGRVGGSPFPANESKRRPGTSRVCLSGLVSRASAVRRSTAARSARRELSRSGDRDRLQARRGSARRSRPARAPAAGATCPAAARSPHPTIATGTSGAPVVSARRAAPRCHGRSGPPSTVPWGKITTMSPASTARAAASTAATSPRSPGDGNRAEALDRAPNQRVPPQLRLREVAERPVDRRADHERVGHRVVVHDDDRRAGRDVAGTLDPQSPREAQERRDGRAHDPVEQHVPRQPSGQRAHHDAPSPRPAARSRPVCRERVSKASTAGSASAIEAQSTRRRFGCSARARPRARR